MLATRTFLFSDLREYTRFVETHGDVAAKELIENYRRIVRAEIGKHEGAEVKTEGDSFYVVFAGARAAVTAGLAILREADRYSAQRAARPMRIGVGVHAGEPVPHEGQYVGSAVIIAARLAQSAAAGELLLTEVVRGLLPRDAELSMEERAVTLKGIDSAPRIYAVNRAPTAAREARTDPAVVIPAAQPASRQILSPQVIGRGRELAALAGHLADARAGRGRAVLVAGEAGLGKSALIRLFAEQARASGARVIVGECIEIEGRRPFGPFVDALRGSGIELPEALGQGAPGAQPVEEAERYRVHAGFAERLASAAVAGPVVVVIEDLHWGDEATYELFPYLARKLRDRSVLLVATYRSDELHRTHPFNHVLAELIRGRLAEEILLRRLTIDEVGDVIRLALRLSHAPTPAFRQALFDRTEGNPFFLEEILRALVESGELEYRDGAWRRTKEVADLAIPLSVRDAVQQRLLGIGEAARRMIQIAAVIGQRFEFEMLREVSGQDEDRVFAAIRDAIDAQLVAEERGDESESYRFRHALSREAVVADLLLRERRILHRTVGEVLERRAPDRVEELAHHFDEARDARAFRYHGLAADAAIEVSAFARAVHHLERAIELATDDEPGLGRLYLRLADAAYASDDLPRALRAAEEAGRMFAGVGDVQGRGESLRRQSRISWHFGRAGAADALAREAVALLETQSDGRALAGALAEVARLAMIDARADEAIQHGQRAIAMARTSGALDVEVDALNTVGSAMSETGDPAGIDLLRSSLDLALANHMAVDIDRGYNNLYVSILRTTDDSREAFRVQGDSNTHMRGLGLQSQSWLNREALNALWSGEWDRLLELVDGSRNETTWAASRTISEAFVLVARNGPDDAIFTALGDARLRLLGGDRQARAEAGRAALPCVLAGRDREALDVAEPSREPLTLMHFGLLTTVAASALIAADRLQDAPAVRTWAETLLAHAGPPWARAASIAFAGGALARLDGRLLEAARLFADSAAAAEAQPPLFDVAAFARFASADLFARSGDLAAAARELERATTFWRRVKATWYLGELDRWAGERGITVDIRA